MSNGMSQSLINPSSPSSNLQRGSVNNTRTSTQFPSGSQSRKASKKPLTLSGLSSKVNSAIWIMSVILILMLLSLLLMNYFYYNTDMKIKATLIKLSDGMEKEKDGLEKIESVLKTIGVDLRTIDSKMREEATAFNELKGIESGLGGGGSFLSRI